jgi:hypothetical protein
VTVEEVATLASRFGWGYEALMSMSGAERRLWLAAAGRVGERPGAVPVPTAPATPAAQPPAGPMSTDAERRARLLALHEELNHRGR